MPSLALGIHTLSHPSLGMKELHFLCGSDLEEEPQFLWHDSSKCTAQLTAHTYGCLHVS